jgi:formylglycine-generating enzyme
MTPKPFTQHLTPHLAFDLIFVEGGSFRMGSDKTEDPDAYDDEIPAHEVSVSDFYMGQYPVTQDVWRSVVEASVGVAANHSDTALDANPSFFTGYRRPVEQVSWDDAQVFIKILNKLTEKSRPEGHIYRLPTEAEWEYAARGGLYARADERWAGSERPKEVGWYSDNSHGETKPAGLKRPNALGLYDMSGNVREWCEDWYSGDYYTSCAKKGLVVNPKGPKKGAGRVLRGGSWYNTAQNCRSAYRHYWLPDDRFFNVGFRLVLAPQSVG